MFLDRDGVVNTFFDGFINTPDRLDAKLIPSSIQAIARLTRESAARVILVTNQSGIDEHRLTEAQHQAIEERLVQRVEEAGGHLDAIYFSPNDKKKFHVPDGEADGRKPGAGMFYRAAQDFGDSIDLADSFMVGDMTTDLAAAKTASPSMTAILVRTGFGGRDHKCDVQPDRTEDNLAAAVDFIIASAPAPKEASRTAPSPP